MLDFALEYELAILAVIALLVAWLMGRSLCKSREYQIQSDLKKQQRENERLETVIERLDRNLHKAYDDIKTEQQRFLEIRQQQAMDLKLHENLKAAHEESLRSLQGLESSQVKLAELGKQHDAQSAEYLGLQHTLHQMQVELQESRNLGKQQKHELERFRQDNEQFCHDYDEQVRVITSLKSALQKAEENRRIQEQNINELQHQLVLEKNKSQQLTAECEQYAQDTVFLKKSLKETQEVLEETREANDKLQRGLKQAQQENSALKSRVMSYEILSSIR